MENTKRYLFVILVNLLLCFHLHGQNGQCWFNVLASELETGTPEFKALIKNSDDGVYAYQKMYSPHPRLRHDATSLNAFIKAKNNVKLKQLGFTDDLLAKVNASTLDDGNYASILGDIDAFGTKMAQNPNIQFENFGSIIGKFTDGNPQNSQAAQWVLQDITAKAEDFFNKTWKFEVTVVNAGGNNSFIDMASVETQPIFIEYKWLTSATVSQTDFIDQFVKRDLFNVRLTDLSKLQWRIKGQKLTKEKVIEYLSSSEGKVAINTQKIRSLFQNYWESSNPGILIEDASELIEYMKLKDDWYVLIFK